MIYAIRREFKKAVVIGSRSSFSKMVTGTLYRLKETWQERQADDAIGDSIHPCRRKKQGRKMKMRKQMKTMLLLGKTKFFKVYQTDICASKRNASCWYRK